MSKFGLKEAGKRSNNVALEDCKIGFMVYKKGDKIKNKHIDEAIERKLIKEIVKESKGKK